MIYNYKAYQLEVKDIDPPSGIVTGYFSAFNTKDSDGDVIRKGAFAKSIMENGPESQRPRIKHLLNHNPGHPLGSIFRLFEDDYGLYYESKVGTHNAGQDFIKMVESNLIKEHSIGFRTIKEQMNTKEGFNEIFEVKLYEGSSLTSWGANEFTPLLDMKSESINVLSERIKSFEKFVRNTDATDETIELCLLEIKQLSALVEKLTQAEKSPEPEDYNAKLKEAITLIQIQNLR